MRWSASTHNLARTNATSHMQTRIHTSCAVSSAIPFACPGMTRVTATLDEDHAEYLEAVKEEENVDSDAAAVRACIDRAQEHEDAQQRVRELEARVEELRNELAAANQRIDAANQLVNYVEEERSLAQRREERERLKDSAGLLTRAKWLLVGMDIDEAEDHPF